ncbi:NAC domain-containing protein 69-like [Mercurialis annua]|uniref:NAC domain-containing protein 69-like n=1 Tax=Mercurialis annua TaxID=3986 RepID=UPI00215FD9A8|nr:NAC domain-containing protein 69-like [Mercurialis annua]
MNTRVGHRFHPTDEELVSYFLKHKIDGHDFLVDDDIHLIDLCKFDPWDLPGFASQGSNDQVWYFFYKREVKYKNAGRTRYNRSTKSGHWKPTGAERSVKAKRSTKVIGIKRTLVFYLRATPKEVKTNWVIHEYEPKAISPHQVELVLCKLKEKSDGKTDASDCDEDKSTRNGDSDFENNRIVIPASEVDQELLLESVLTGREQQPFLTGDGGICIDDLMLTDFDNGSDGMAFQFETEEDRCEMADLFLNFDGYPTEEDSGRIHHNHSSPRQSLSGVYLDDFTDMDAEIIYNRSSQFGTPNSNDNRSTLKEYRQTQSVQTLTETLPPSRYEQSGRVKNHVNQDDILVMEASSVDSNTYRTEEIKCIGVTSKKHPIQAKQSFPILGNIQADKSVAFLTEHPIHVKHSFPRSGIIPADKRVDPRQCQIQGKISVISNQKVEEARKPANAANLPHKSSKESIPVQTEKNQKMISAKASLKLRTTEMEDNKKMGSFILMQISPLSQKPSPPSVYAVNIFIGLLLFIAVSREILILH